MSNQTIQLKPFYDFSDDLGDHIIASIGVGPEQDAVVLSVNPNDPGARFVRSENPLWAKRHNAISTQGYSGRLLRWESGRFYTTEVPEFNQASPHIQPLVNGCTLVAATRIGRHQPKLTQNAAVYDRDGKIVRRMAFGDAIQSVQATSGGRIWVSYFDESGIGLTCFTSAGEVLWSFWPPDGYPSMCDCYALNVLKEEAWSCYYPDFPVINVDAEFKISAWRNDIIGARALAIHEQTLLLWGGYSRETTQCVIQKIEGNQITSRVDLSITLSNANINKTDYVVGRGPILHIFAGTEWYQLDVRDLV